MIEAAATITLTAGSDSYELPGPIAAWDASEPYRYVLPQGLVAFEAKISEGEAGTMAIRVSLTEEVAATFTMLGGTLDAVPITVVPVGEHQPVAATFAGLPGSLDAALGVREPLRHPIAATFTLLGGSLEAAVRSAEGIIQLAEDDPIEFPGVGGTLDAVPIGVIPVGDDQPVAATFPGLGAALDVALGVRDPARLSLEATFVSLGISLDPVPVAKVGVGENQPVATTFPGLGGALDAVPIRVVVTPVFADDMGEEIRGNIGIAITAVTIPRATGVPDPTYSQIGATPSGLTVTLPTSTADGLIEGTPDQRAAGAIRIRATNSSGVDEWTVPYAFFDTLELALELGGTISGAFSLAPEVGDRLELGLQLGGTISGAFSLTPVETSAPPITDPDAYARGQARALAGASPRYALEITHPAITEPVRIVADNIDHTIEGNRYIALAFRAQPPQFQEGQVPRATLEIDNVGRELTQWVETTGGGRGAKMRVMMVHRDTSGRFSHIVWELPALAVGVTELTNELVQAQLVYRSGKSRPGIKGRHDPTTSPGLF